MNMKMKLRVFSWLAVLTLMVGCQNEAGMKVTQSNCSFLASIESAVNGSRTAVDDEGNVTWIETDAIGVFGSVTNNAEFTSTGNGTSVLFEGNLSVEGEEVRCVYYPYDETASLEGSKLTFSLPAEYTYTGASHAPMLGVKNDDNGYNFKHLCGLMRVSIVGVPVGTSTFTLVSEGENAPAIAGTAIVNDINATDATLELNGNMSNRITVTIKAEEMTNATLYLPLPVGTYSKLSVTYKDETAEYFNKSTSNVIMKRGMLLDMPVVATIEKYLDEIDNHVSTLDLENYDYEGLKAYLTTWLGQQDFVANCNNISNDCYEEIEITTLGGLKGCIILSKSEEESEDVYSRSAEENKTEAFNVAKESGESFFETTYVKAYSFALMWGDKQEEGFDEAINLSPVNLQKTRLEDKVNAIPELLSQNYRNNSVILMTGTHGYHRGDQGGCFLVRWEDNYSYVRKNHIEKLALWYDFGEKGNGYDKWWITGEFKYFLIKPRFFYDNDIFKFKPLVYASYCYSSRTWQGYSLYNLESNFLGYFGMSYKNSNKKDIFNFFYNLFNGVTVENAYKLAHSESENGSFYYNGKILDQRYFSIDTRLFKVVDGYMDVGAQILGWDKLKGIIDTEWKEGKDPVYKTNQLKYMVYYSNSPFESPTEAGVYSKQIGFYKVDFQKGIVWEHYQPVRDDILQSQCRIKVHNYFTLGFEYTDPEGKRKIYYGDIKTGAGASASASRDINENDSSFMSFDAESLKTFKEQMIP